MVGCGHATTMLTDGEIVTVSCAEGDTGNVYRGRLAFDTSVQNNGSLPEISVKLMLNVGNPSLAFEFAQLPSAGVGLARVEFIINNLIGVHPKAILSYATAAPALREAVIQRAHGYADPRTFTRKN